MLLPKEFLSVAEKSGIMMRLGRWVLNQACRQMKLWTDAGIAPPQIAINLSMAQLKGSTELIQDVRDITAQWGLSPSVLEFDVTEATLAQTTLASNDALTRLREVGAKVAIDDFGTEYSSFTYPRAYGVSHLKIARDYIARAVDRPEIAATVRAIIHLARELGIGVIAEGSRDRAAAQPAGGDRRGHQGAGPPVQCRGGCGQRRRHAARGRGAAGVRSGAEAAALLAGVDGA
jgi:EAL domain-containing protein (putative c-di-GMP-specific phosphodiesterase class I)